MAPPKGNQKKILLARCEVLRTPLYLAYLSVEITTPMSESGGYRAKNHASAPSVPPNNNQLVEPRLGA